MSMWVLNTISCSGEGGLFNEGQYVVVGLVVF